MKDMQERIAQLETDLARLETQSRNADGLIALLLGVVAEASGVEVELDKEILPGLSSEWVDHIIERFEIGQDAHES